MHTSSIIQSVPGQWLTFDLVRLGVLFLTEFVDTVSFRDYGESSHLVSSLKAFKRDGFRSTLRNFGFQSNEVSPKHLWHVHGKLTRTTRTIARNFHSSLKEHSITKDSKHAKKITKNDTNN